MVNLRDIFNPDELDELTSFVLEGYISRRSHPTYPLHILNYTDKTTYDRKWTSVTRQCRGLIYNSDTFDVVARPFPKIFNVSEPDAPYIPLEAPVRVTDKIDGSLGILYPQPDGQWAIATRGSFTSGQAIHATELLRKKYADDLTGASYGWTHLFEIVYPKNRIVLDYGDLDDLIYLGSIEIESGERHDWLEWPQRADIFFYASYAHCLSAAPRPNAEGYVIQSEDGTVKLKQQDYVELHRIIFGLNARAVWRVLSAVDTGETWEEFLERLPEEFQEWAVGCADALLFAHKLITSKVYREYNDIIEKLSPEFTRKDFAQLATTYDYPAPLFMLLDGNGDRVDEWAWKQNYPDAGWSPRATTEE